KVFKEKVGGAKTDRAELAKLLPQDRARRHADCHPPRPAGALYQRPAQRHRCACRSGLSCKRSLAGRSRSRRPTVPHDFPIAYAATTVKICRQDMARFTGYILHPSVLVSSDWIKIEAFNLNCGGPFGSDHSDIAAAAPVARNSAAIPAKNTFLIVVL